MTADDFQARSSGQGRDFEDVVAGILRFRGWHVDDMRVPVAERLPTVDIVATDPKGVTHWIECKGADGQSKRAPGCSDGTTVKVAVGVAAALSTLPHRPPYLLVTSHLPKPGSIGERMLAVAVEQRWFDAVLDLGQLTTADGIGIPVNDGDNEQEEGWTG